MKKPTNLEINRFVGKYFKDNKFNKYLRLISVQNLELPVVHLSCIDSKESIKDFQFTSLFFMELLTKNELELA